MILADEPAYDLPPISRALKFLDFDRLLARLVNDSPASEPSRATAAPGASCTDGEPSGEGRAITQDSTLGAAAGGFGPITKTTETVLNCAQLLATDRSPMRDYWADGSTDPGGYHGEIELTPVGAVPVAELEG